MSTESGNTGFMADAPTLHRSLVLLLLFSDAKSNLIILILVKIRDR